MLKKWKLDYIKHDFVLVLVIKYNLGRVIILIEVMKWGDTGNPGEYSLNLMVGPDCTGIASLG